MRHGSNSSNHHWWPVGLQQYWADKRGNVSWIEPLGNIQKKKHSNRKIGYKRQGHTIFKGSLWENNFEKEFDIDNEVHNIVAELRRLKPLGSTMSEFFALMKLFFKEDGQLREQCKYYLLDESLHRNLLLFLLSLLIRSPAQRSRYEGYPTMFGLQPSENVAKANMSQNYRTAKKLCQTASVRNQYFVLLHSPMKKFICGDGYLDWLTSSLVANRISGRALLPLTPNICIYFYTPMSMRTSNNCAALTAAPWIVDWINEITQIYSRDRLFFLGKPPKLSNAFRQHKFLEHADKTDALIEMFDEVVDGGLRRYSNFGSGLS